MRWSLSGQKLPLIDQKRSTADHAHLMAGVTSIIALDMYEHSYHMDYSANAEGYVDAFMENIDWGNANERCAWAVAQSTAGNTGLASRL